MWTVNQTFVLITCFIKIEIQPVVRLINFRHHLSINNSYREKLGKTSGTIFFDTLTDQNEKGNKLSF